MNQLREQVAEPDLQTTIDQALAQGFLRHQNYTEAIPLLQRLQSKWPESNSVRENLAQAFIYTNQFPQASALIQTIEQTEPGSLSGMRLRARLLAQQMKFSESAALEARICANPKASPLDWNDQAWVNLFAQPGEKPMQAAAEKAAELDRNPAILHTLAIVQAASGDLKDARATAYRLMDTVDDPDESLTIFGRIAEQLDLPNVAADYYKRVKKSAGNSTLSTYAFAQMRLKESAIANSPGPAPKAPI